MSNETTKNPDENQDSAKNSSKEEFKKEPFFKEGTIKKVNERIEEIYKKSPIESRLTLPEEKVKEIFNKPTPQQKNGNLGWGMKNKKR